MKHIRAQGMIELGNGVGILGNFDLITVKVNSGVSSRPLSNWVKIFLAYYSCPYKIFCRFVDTHVKWLQLVWGTGWAWISPTLASQWYARLVHEQLQENMNDFHTREAYTKIFHTKMEHASCWMLHTSHSQKFPVLRTFINCIINGQRILLVTERTRQSKIGSRKQTPCMLT